MSFASLWRIHDARFEDVQKLGWRNALIRDVNAGLSVAISSLPLNIGFSVASGMSPAAGIICATISAIICALFGGSKYAVAGPTAPLIPILATFMLESVSYILSLSIHIFFVFWGRQLPW